LYDADQAPEPAALGPASFIRRLFASDGETHMSQIPMPGNASPTRSHAGGWPTQSARLKGVLRTAPPSSVSLHQNHKQRPPKRSTCGGEDDPKDARFELESFVIGFESVYEFIALLACKRLPIVGSVLTSLHAAETLFLKKPRRDQCHKGYQSGQK
jgi:hypothetical protein